MLRPAVLRRSSGRQARPRSPQAKRRYQTLPDDGRAREKLTVAFVWVSRAMAAGAAVLAPDRARL